MTYYTDSFNPFESQPVQKQISPKVHVLFMVDNSGSTAPYQAKLSAGFKDFGTKYLGMNNFDLSAAVITSDTYLAGQTTDTASYGPNMGACYSRLVPGIHDGVRPNIADGLSNPFTAGTCDLTPNALASIKANKDRSLSPILSTRGMDGLPLDSAGLLLLTSNFQLNALPGTNGSGDERGMQSLHQFLKDNEERDACKAAVVTDPTCFFGHYTLTDNPVPPVNIVVMISDEHDHSVTNFGTGAVVDHSYNTFKAFSDATMLTSSVTLAQAAKARFDAFFKGLHEASNTDANYSMFAITNATCNTANNVCGVQSRSKVRNSNEEWGIEYATLVDAYAGNDGTNGRAKQNADTVNSEAKFSKVYDINGTDYHDLFDNIALKTIDSTKWVLVNTFTTTHDIKSADGVVAVVVLGNGTEVPVPPSAISVTQPRMISISAAVLQGLVPADDTKAAVKITYAY